MAKRAQMTIKQMSTLVSGRGITLQTVGGDEIISVYPPYKPGGKAFDMYKEERAKKKASK